MANKAFRSRQRVKDGEDLLNQGRVSRYLLEMDPYSLEIYLQKCLSFLHDLTEMQASLYLSQDVKVGLEVTLTHAFGVSDLKINGSSLSQKTMKLMYSVASNLLVIKGIKEQSESPLITALL